MANRLSFEDVSESYVRFFRIKGLLPFQGKSSNYLGTHLLFGYFFFINLLLWSSYASNLCNESELNIGTIAETLMVLGLSIRYYLVILKRTMVQSLLEEMEEIWSMCTEEGHRIIVLYQRKMRRLHYFFLCSIFFIYISYIVNGLKIRLPSNKPNGTEYRMLPFKWYTNDGENLWPSYWPIFAIQCLIFLSTVVTACLCGTVFAGLTMITAGYFKYLRVELLRIAEPIDPNDASWYLIEREISHLLKFHQKLLKLSSTLIETVQAVLLALVTFTCYNISMMAFKLASSDPDRSKYLSTTIASICNLFIGQWPADCIFDESEAIGEAAYSALTTWMRCQHSKSLILIILRAQRPVEIKAGGLIRLSLETFGSMMVNAYSFFTVLRSFDL